MNKQLSIKQIKSILLSENEGHIIEVLDILSKKYYSDITETLKELQKKDNPEIQKKANSILKKYSLMEKSKENKELSVDSLEGFIEKFQRLDNVKFKIKILKSLNYYKFKPEDFIYKDKLIELFIHEDNYPVSNEFAKILFKWFGNKIQKNISDFISKENIKNTINAIIFMTRADSQSGFEKVVQLYNSLGDSNFIYFASNYLWKYSKLIVIAKLKKMTLGNDDTRMNVAKICSSNPDYRLKGILSILIDDKNKDISKIAVSVMDKINKNEKNIKNKVELLPKDFFLKFSKILKESDDFQEKLNVMNVLNNIGSSKFLPIIEQELKWETNLFLISSYVKFLGKYGDNEYIDLLLPYFDYTDVRVVANCIEGLAFSRPNKKLIDIFKEKISNPHHRISSQAAVALWKFNEKEIVYTFLEKAVKSEDIWVRKASLLIMDNILDVSFKKFLKILITDSHKEISSQAKVLIDIIENKENEEKANPNELIEYIITHNRIPEHFIAKNINLIKEKRSSTDQKIKSIKMLSFIANDETYKDLYQMYLNTGNIRLRASLLEAIGKTFSGGKQFLLDILIESFEPMIIVSAINTLEFHNINDCLEELFPFLYNENPKIVMSTTKLLYKNIPQDILKKILLMSSSKNKKIRFASLYALSQIRVPETYMRLKEMVLDNESNISITADTIIKVFENNSEIMDKLNKISEINKQETIKEPKNSKPNIEDSPKSEKKEIKSEELSKALYRIKEMPMNNTESFISNKVAPLIQSDNVEVLLNYAAKHKDFDIIQHIAPILGKYLTNEKVNGFFDWKLNSNDITDKLVALKGLSTDTKSNHFYENVISLLDSKDKDLKAEALQTLFANKMYRIHVFEDLTKKNKNGKRIVKELNKICPILEQDKKKSKTDKKSSSPERKNAWAKPKKAAKQIKKTQPAKTNKDSSIPISYLVVIIFLFIALMFSEYLFLTKKNLENSNSHSQSTSDTSNVNNNNSVRSDGKLNLKPILNKMKKIYTNPNIEKSEIFYQLMQEIDNISINYKRNEFFSVKKFLKLQNYKAAKSELIKVVNNINKGFVMWNYKKNEWISKQEAKKRWSQVVDQ